MIRKSASSRKRMTKGATNGNGPTIKRRPVVTGDRMGHCRHILPDHGRAHPDRQRRGAEAKAPIAIRGDQHDLRGSWSGRRSWLSDGGYRRRCLSNSRGCRCRACAGSSAAAAGGKQRECAYHQQAAPGGCAASWQVRVL